MHAIRISNTSCVHVVALGARALPQHQHGGEGGEKKTQESASCMLHVLSKLQCIKCISRTRF